MGHSELGLWNYVTERHQIYLRRARGDPPPWTDDPILRQFRFCNVYRALDKGTLWYTAKVVPTAEGPRDLLWKTTVYRLVNNWQIFKAVGGVAGEHVWRRMLSH